MPRLSCPYCQARYIYQNEHISPDDCVTCQNCNRLMRVRKESSETLPIEDVVVKSVFNKPFLILFAITMLLIFIIFLVAESTLDLDWPPGLITVFSILA